MDRATLTSRIASKLRSTQGFMLGEQLISIIFIGLLCIAVTAGIGAAMTAFGSVSQSTESQALLNRTVQEVSDELAYSSDVDTSAASFPSFVSGSVHARVSLGNEKATNPVGIILKGDGISSGNPANTGEAVLLIPAVGDFVPRITALTYEASNNVWTFTIEIVRKGTNDVLAKTTMNVARIGN